MTSIKSSDTIGFAVDYDASVVYFKTLTAEEVTASKAHVDLMSKIAKILCLRFGEDCNEDGECSYGDCQNNVETCEGWIDFTLEAQEILDALGFRKPKFDLSDAKQFPLGSEVTVNFGSPDLFLTYDPTTKFKPWD